MRGGVGVAKGLKTQDYPLRAQQQLGKRNMIAPPTHRERIRSAAAVPPLPRSGGENIHPQWMRHFYICHCGAELHRNY